MSAKKPRKPREEQAADELLEDMRDRRTLKWFFDPDAGRICSHFDSISAEVIEEIRSAWVAIIGKHLRAQKKVTK